jgi:hypothetical protein
VLHQINLAFKLEYTQGRRRRSAAKLLTKDEARHAELIAQLSDMAKQLGIEINLNYSFAQQSSATEPDGSDS